MTLASKLKFHTKLPKHELERLPVSTLVDSVSGEERVISVFSDDYWNFRHELMYHGSTTSINIINWKDFLGSDHLLDKRKAQVLIVSCKSILYSLKKERVNGYRAWSGRTVFNNHGALRTLAQWMSKRGVYRFKDLTKRHLEDFRRFISEEFANTPSQRVSVFQIINAIVQQKDRLLDPLPAHPWPMQDVLAMAGYGKDSHGQTPAIPIEVAADLFGEAFRQVEGAFPVVRHYVAWRKQRAKALEKFKCANLSTLGRKFLRGRPFESVQDLVNAVGSLRSACIVTIMGLSGMRASEYVNLKRNCLLTSTGKDGQTFYWVKGYTFKLHEEPHPHQWAVPKIVHRAIKILRILNREDWLTLASDLPWFEENGEGHRERSNHYLLNIERMKRQMDNLHLRIQGSDRANRVNVITDAGVRVGLQRFVEEYDIRDIDGQLWPISSHQFRRTFARMIAASGLGDLRYLRQHLDHWTVQMTTHYAKGGQDEAELFTLIREERIELQTELTMGWLDTNEPVSGGAAERIKEVRSRPEVMAITNKREFAQMVSAEVVLRGNGHSWCLASQQGCGGHGLYDSVLCVTCGDGVIDRTHAAFWLAMRDQQRELLAEFGDDLGEPVRVRCERHLEKAEKVLRELELLETT